MTIVAGLKKQRLRRAVFYEVLRKTLCHSRLFQPLSASFASVLGAQVTNKPSDLYNLPHVGLYYWNSQSEAPSNAAVPQGSLVQYTEYGSIKILKQYANSGNVYINFKWGNNDWKGWEVFTLSYI